ncbi:MAG: TonB family protein [Sphingomonadales bacterium]
MIADNEWTGSLPRSRQLTVAAAVIAIHALAGFALFQSRTAEGQALRDRIMDVIVLRMSPAPPPEQLRPAPRQSRPSGEAAPPNLKNVPTEIVVPPPVLTPIVVPVVTAPVADKGAAANAGAALVAGPGTGAGGEGNGRGAGGAGNGDGDGEGGIPPEHVRGRLSNSDYPRGMGEAGVQGNVGVRYRVSERGRVSDCQVTRSSGNKILDDTTCRLITERFRFSPSRDERGRPVAAYIVENHEWISQHD